MNPHWKRHSKRSNKNGLEAIDPYLLSLNVLLERFYFDLKHKDTKGYVIAESRGNTFNIREKSENIAGLQLADLVVTPIGRFVLGKRIKEDFWIIEKKFRNFGRGYEGTGLIILPK